MSNVLRNIPSVSELLDRPPIRRLLQQANRGLVVSGVRDFLDNLRTEVQTAAADFRLPDASELAERIAQWIVTSDTPSLRPVINATGILLHTGLGRAPLAEAAVQAVRTLASGYCSLEYDLPGGSRSHRIQAVEKLLRQLTGAEAAAVVNNNAGATYLVLAALAHQREVIVSRGQLIEIGGSYRLPEVMQASGSKLREVGTTNKTHLTDYRTAIGPQTAALMRVHTSNFVVVGFTQSVDLPDLVRLAHDHNLPVIDDIGSGALLDFAQWGIADEPVASHSIRTGADVVLFSGDKLLGGPQCGIIVGRQKYIDSIVAHPMMRALRVDKMTLAALAATLRLYLDPEEAQRSIPLLSMLSTPLDNLKNRAQRLAPQIAATGVVRQAVPLEDICYLGGGSVPSQQLKTWCVQLEPSGSRVDQLAARLRQASLPVVGRIQKDHLLLDLRTVLPREDIALVEAFREIASSTTPSAPTPPE